MKNKMKQKTNAQNEESLKGQQGNSDKGFGKYPLLSSKPSISEYLENEKDVYTFALLILKTKTRTCA